MARIDRALEYFNNGYNCCQSVIMAYCDMFGLSAEKGQAVAAGYGGGIAGMRQMCGVLNSMVILAGLRFGNDAKNKTSLNETIKLMFSEFQSSTGSDNCKILLTKAAGFHHPIFAEYDASHFKRPCAKYVILACEIIESKLLGQQ